MAVYIDSFDKRGCDLAVSNRHDSYDRLLMAVPAVRRLAVWIDGHRDDRRHMVRQTARHIPNAITVGRMLLAIPMAIGWLASLRTLQAAPTFWHTLVAVALFMAAVVAVLLDALDGTLATQGNVSSNFGRLVDPLGDKFVIMVFYYTLWLATQTMLDAVWLHRVTVLVVIDVVINSCLGSVGLARGLQLPYRPSYRPPQAEIWGKIKANAQGAAVFSWALGLMLLAHGLKMASQFFLLLFAGMMGLAIFCGLLSLRRHVQQLHGGVRQRVWVARGSAVVATAIAYLGWRAGLNNDGYYDNAVWLVLCLVIGGIYFGLIHRLADSWLVWSQVRRQE